MLLMLPGVIAQEEDLVCHYPGQTYEFTTICDDNWVYKWTATDGTFKDGVDDTCSINWTAPSVGAEKNVTLYVTAYNNQSYDEQMFVSCIAMAEKNVTICPLVGITVIKDADPDDITQEFEFAIRGEDVLGGTFAEDFGLYGVGTGLGNSWTNNTLLPGTYIVNESTLYCWNLTNIACDGNALVEFGDGETFHADYAPGDTSVKIVLGSGSSSICTFTNIKKLPGIEVVKTANYGPDPDTPVLNPGTNISYWINVTNTGEVNLTDVKVTDLKLGLNDETFSTDLGVGFSVNKTYYYIVDDSDMCNNIDNTVMVNATNSCDDAVVSDTDGWSIPTDITQSFDIIKTPNVTAPVHVGDVIGYTIVVTNTGNVNATLVNVTDVLTSLSHPTSLETKWTLLKLAPGENTTLQTNYTVVLADIPGSINNIATVTSFVGPCGGLDINEWDSKTIPTDYTANITVTKTANYGPCPDNPAGLGTNITYTINVTNTGEVNLTNVKITDIMLGLDGDSIPGLDVLEPGKSKEATFYHEVTAPELCGEIINTVEVNATVDVDLVSGFGLNQDEYVSDTDTWCVPTICPTEFDVRKIALNKTVQRCDEITYLIQIRSDFDTLENVTVKDVFDKDVEFISASPEPDDDGIWRFAKVNVTSLPADETDSDWKTLITLTVKVPDKQDFEYDMAQGVTGEGFVNVKNDYSTTYKSYVITNCIELTTDTIPGQVFKDCVSVTVTIDPGTELSTREHGSGTYESEELVAVRTENKSISMDKDMAATYSSTTLGLYNNRTVTYSSRWTEEANAKNRVTGTSLSEQYRYATTIDRESSFFLDENESVMNIDSEFDGMGHIGFLKMETNSSTYHDTPTAEIREDYVGSFKVLEHADEYGSGVSYEKTTTGSGFVVGDRRVGESQRSYESGTGTYDSEEIIETATNYIAKDISLVYAPMNQSLTDDVSISASQKWKEGMYSTTPQTSYIGEEFTSLDYLDKETIAKGINEMNTEASFEGRARFRALLESSNQSEPLVDFDEQYDGDYSIERNVLFTGVPKYDKPHLNVTKTLDSLVEEDDGDEEREVATYTITIENDGNEGLEPVHVTDYFPPGASFIDSSLRPDEVTDTFANWTLTHLNIGDVAAITLRLDVTSYHPDELVNTVVVCGDYDNENETVCARNYSALEIDWLTCCPSGPVSVTTTAELDEENENVVRYSVEIRNAEDVTRVATVTDWLPDGMELIDSSIPFASYDGGVVVWNLIDIEPLGTETIEFSALAPGDGRFTNTVEVDPRSVDGPVVQPVSASCVIDVGIVEDECGSVSCDSWQPPNWEFEHYGYGSDETSCEDLSCASCDGTDYILAP